MATASLRSFTRDKLTAGRDGVHLNRLHISQDLYIVSSMSHRFASIN